MFAFQDLRPKDAVNDKKVRFLGIQSWIPENLVLTYIIGLESETNSGGIDQIKRQKREINVQNAQKRTL